MNKIRCLIIDDEALAREGLKNYVAQIEFLKLIGVCKNALQAQNIINEQPIDLVFLDIEMPKLTGITFLRTIKNAPYVIFTTAYSQYALESFEFDVIDYLLKPISLERFLQAVNKAFRIINKTAETSEDSYFFIKDGHTLVKVFITEILFIEAAQNYVNIVTVSNKYMALIQLKSILELVPEEQFVQIHRSCVVAIPKIDVIDGNQIIIQEHKLQISRRLKNDVLNKILDDRII